MRRHQSEVVGRQRTAEGPQAKWAGLVAHLVRDEGVAGSNPATPTSFLVAPIHLRGQLCGTKLTGKSRGPVSRRSAGLIAVASVDFRCRSFGGAARAPMRRLLPPASTEFSSAMRSPPRARSCSCPGKPSLAGLQDLLRPAIVHRRGDARRQSSAMLSSPAALPARRESFPRPKSVDAWRVGRP
jgi:hypothetical protein